MRLKSFLHEDYLTEKTFSIGQDVKYVYNRCFKGLIDDIQIQAGAKAHKQFGGGKYLNFTPPAIERIRNGKYNYFWKKVIRQGNLYDATYDQIMSEELPSKASKVATKVNPAVISCGVFRGGNYYVPKEELQARGQKAPGGGPMDRGYISLSLNGGALQVALTNAQQQLPASQIKSFNQEFSGERIQSTIAHEISHWLNDTMHNFHITKDLRITRELNKPEFMKLHNKDVNMTHFEVDAQIHGIKQLKMQYRKKWDEFTLADVYFKYNSLRYMGGQIYQNYGKEVGDIWQKLIVKRMAREKLLGKKMKGFAKYPEDFK